MTENLTPNVVEIVVPLERVEYGSLEEIAILLRFRGSNVYHPQKFDYDVFLDGDAFYGEKGVFADKENYLTVPKKLSHLTPDKHLLQVHVYSHGTTHLFCDANVLFHVR